MVLGTRGAVRGPIVQTISVKTAALPGGLSLPYAETGDPAGTPVVFVHAYVESWRYFEVVLRHLPASLHGYAPTQRGHGDADRPREGYRAEDTAADIVGFMDAVGIGRTVLVGSSSGGLVSQVVASTHPHRVSALVLISTPATLADKPGVAAMWDEISILEDPLARDFVEGFVRSTSPRSVPDEFVDVLTAESLKVPARVWKETLRGLIDADLTANLDRITAPTLLISGDDDAFVSSDQDVILRGIPDARLLVYKGAGHGVHLAQPERVIEDIVNFLRQPVEPKLRVLDVEDLHGRESRPLGIVPQGVGAQDRAGASAPGLHAHSETMQRAEAVEEPLHLVSRDGEGILGPLVRDQHGPVGAG